MGSTLAAFINQSTCPFGLHFGFMHLGLAFYLFIGIIWFAFWIHASASGFFFFFWHFGFMRLAFFFFDQCVLHCFTLFIKHGHQDK